MGQNSRKLVYDSGKSTIFWDWDIKDDIHIRVSFCFDHSINGDELLQAWKKTLKVYPLLDLVPDRINDHILFFEPKEEVRVVESREPVMPREKLAAERCISVSYYDDTVTVLAFHSVIDGKGIMTVSKTLAYHYCCIHFNKIFDPNGFTLSEGRQITEYYKPFTSCPLGDYTSVPMMTFPENAEYFSDSDMVPDASGKIISGTLGFSYDNFIEICRKNGANPSVMMCILLAKATYRLHIDEHRDMVYFVTMDFREALGITESIAQCSWAAMLELPYAEAMSNDIGATAKVLRSALNTQRTEDYVKSCAAMLRTYNIDATACSGIVSYFGDIGLGELQEHITGMMLANNSCNTVNLIQFGDEYMLLCQLGIATERYMKALTTELKKLGIDTRVVREPSSIITERRE
ncbi:MAG: hypothetical protein IK093_08215 [Ruminiclostridium sp.]|nr:hypothetical protein [Ruminiclostridium sp.]